MVNKINDSKNYFQGSYEYGPQNQQIRKKSILERFLKTNLIRPFKSFIYSGASFLQNKYIDPVRVEKAREQLTSFGGECVKMKTPDGDIIDGMYLGVNNFKACLEKYFYLTEIKNEDGTISQKMFLKPEFCVKDEKLPGKTYLRANKEAQLFIDSIKGLLHVVPAQILNEDTRCVGLDLGKIPQNLTYANLDANISQPTVLISPGADMTYAAYKGLAVAYMLKGINVMMVDFRGYGQSEGSPTPHKTKLDLETAYQYLVIEKKIDNRDLLVHGHCMGGGPAANLAARRKGVNLVLDRSFAEYRDIAKNRFPQISDIIYKILPGIVNYNNAKNLASVEGHIAIEMAKNDAVIPEEQIVKLIDSLPNTKAGQIVKLMDSEDGHSGLWTDDVNTSLQFEQFLQMSGLRRRLF